MVMAKRNNKYGKYTGKTKLEQRIRQFVDSGMTLEVALATAKQGMLSGNLFSEVDDQKQGSKTDYLISDILSDTAEGQRISVRDPATGQLTLTNFVNKKSPKHSFSRGPLAIATQQKIEEEI